MGNKKALLPIAEGEKRGTTSYSPPKGGLIGKTLRFIGRTRPPLLFSGKVLRSVFRKKPFLSRSNRQVSEKGRSCVLLFIYAFLYEFRIEYHFSKAKSMQFINLPSFFYFFTTKIYKYPKNCKKKSLFLYKTAFFLYNRKSVCFYFYPRGIAMFDLQVFLLTLQKVAFLLVVILIGYLLRKTGKVGRGAASTLSFLTTTIFSPAYVLRVLPDQFTAKNLGANLWILVLSVCIVFFCVVVGRCLAKIFARDDFEKKSLCYVFAFANTGYFGYPVIEGVFGEEVLARFMVLCIPFNMTIFSYGYGLFVNSEKKFDWKKVFFSPTMLSYYVSILMGLTGFRFPAFLSDAIDATGACMSPACMLSIGIVLGCFALKDLLSGWRPYLYSFIRLVILPVLFGIALYSAGVKGFYFAIGLASVALPVGLNVVVFPESFGQDSSKNAKTCFVSILMSIITLPVVFALVKTIALM